MVKAVGPEDAKVVIVGEAPGRHEVMVGEPFVGPSGKLLTSLLHRAGILRPMCYITNVVKEQPPRNDISHFIDLSKKVPIISDKGQMYLNNFRMEMTRLQPNLIIAVGNTSLWALTGEKGITKWRGSIIADTLGRKVIPIIHPASALRTYIQRYYIAMDLQKAARHMHDPTIPEDHRVYYIEPSYEQSIEYLQACKKQPLVAFDIEVIGKEVSCISFSYDKNHAISIPFVDGQFREYFTIPQEAYVWREITEILENPNIEKVGQNVTFDATFLYNKYGIRSRNLHDTMVAQGILYPDFPKGLGFITTQYTDLPYYKDEGKEKDISGNKRRIMRAAGHNFWLYNAKDSIVLMEALPKQLAELHAQGNLDTYNRQRRLIEPLVFMAEHGIRLDLAGMKEKADKIDVEVEELKRQFVDIAGPDVSPTSPTQLKKYFYVTKNLPPYKNPKSGKPTTDEKALKRIARKGYKEASIILEIRGRAKLKSTYLDLTPSIDGRLKSSFNPIGTSTGRLSSSANIFGEGTNQQNLPLEMKEFLIPDDGYVIYEIDLSQAENRIVAYIAPDEKMIQAFEDGIDIHSLTGSFLCEMPIEVVKAQDKLHKSDPDNPDYLSPLGMGDRTWRYWGKQANHALNYGMYYKRASLLWEIPEKDAKFIYERYHRAYPGVRKMHRWVLDSLKTDRTVQNLFLRRRRFLERWDDIQKDANAFIPQSTVADIMNERAVNFLYYRQDLFKEAILLSQIHDSIVFQLPLDLGWQRHAEIVQIIQQNLETPLTFRGRSFVIPAEVKICPINMKMGIELSEVSAESLEKAYNSAIRVAA